MCVLYIRLSIQWAIWVFFFSFSLNIPTIPARGKVLRDPKWEKDRIYTDWSGSLRAFSLSVGRRMICV